MLYKNDQTLVPDGEKGRLDLKFTSKLPQRKLNCVGAGDSRILITHTFQK